MREYASNEDFYKHIDELVVELQSIGHEAVAERIDFILHGTSWTTTSELFGELRVRFQELLDSRHPIPQKIKDDVTGFITTIDRVWDRANGITQ